MTLKNRNFLLLLFLVGLAVAAGWVFASRHKNPGPISDHPRLATGVLMRDVAFHSRALNREMRYRVFLPENAGNRKLPVIYLLHGGGGTFRDWSNYSDVAQFAAAGLLLVMPQGDYSYYTNAVQRPQDRYEDYVVDDLRADVETRFPARSDRAGRAIVGVSMGGFGAIKLALDHPDKFVFAGALSPAIDVPRRKFTWRRLNQSRQFEAMFGPDGSATRRSSDPFFLVTRADSKSVPYFYLVCGTQESLLAPNREFSALLGRYGIAHEFHIAPGGHEWNRWSAETQSLFQTLRRHLDIRH